MKYLTKVFLKEYGISIWNVSLCGKAKTGGQHLAQGSIRSARAALLKRSSSLLSAFFSLYHSMEGNMRFLPKKPLLLLSAFALVPVLFLARARGSDHADTPQIAASPGTDLTDVYIFPSPTNANNVVLAMNVNPLIASGQGPNAKFDTTVLYQFKIDNTGDNVEDLVIQAWAENSGATQTIKVAGPAAPTQTGIQSTALAAHALTGTINTPFSPTANMQVFAGAREDSFFFDLEQFFTILPDRATPITGTVIADPNVPKAATWRDAANAKDFLSVNKLNVLSIVVELPKTAIRGAANGKINVWCTTSR
jgi:hypothetical protein